jgi:hypothetical protein
MSNSPFIEQLYVRFLGRSSDAAGLAYWGDLLDRGVLNAAQITQQFLDSAEFSNAIEPVARLYYTAFGRIPDADGLQYWITRAQAGTSLDDIAAAFTSSAEFKGRFGSLSNAAFIDGLYHSALEHDAPSSVRSAWLADFNAKRSDRADFLLALANSAEVIRDKADEIRIISQYHGTLGEAPSELQIRAALGREDDLGLITQLYSSPDYDGAVVPGLITHGVAAARAFVFIDGNGNGILDKGESFTTADAIGNYSFSNGAGFGRLITAGGGSGGGSVVLPTGPDVIAPTLTGGTTVNGATSHSITTLTFTFSETVKIGTGYIILTDGHSQRYLESGVVKQRIVGDTHTRTFYVGDDAIAISGNTLTITMDSTEATALRALTTYSVVMEDGAILDAADNPFKGLVFSDLLRFTTGAGLDTTKPLATAAQYMEGGYKKLGQHVDIKVTFDEAVTALPGAGLQLETGATDGFAAYHSGNGTNVLWFRYTVQADDLANPVSLISPQSDLANMIKDLNGNVIDAAHIVFNSLSYGGGSYGSPLNIDGGVPLAPTPELFEGHDTGTLLDDGWINTSGFTLTGANVEPLSTVYLYLNGATEALTSTFSATGTWSFNLSGVTEGTYQYTTKVIDQAGNVSSPASAPLEVHVDFTAPGAPTDLALRPDQDNGTLSNDHVTTFTQPIFTGTAEAFARVKLRDVNDVVIGEATANESGFFTIHPAAPLSLNVTHTLHVIQVDRAGNLGPTSSATTTVTVISASSTPATPGMPVLGTGMDTGTLGDGLTKNTVIALSVSDVLPNQILKFYDNGVYLTEVTAPASGPWTGNITLGSGTHILTVKNVDGNGGESAASAPLNIEVDILAPDAPGMPTLYGQNDSGTLGDHKTNFTAPRFTGSADPGTKLELMQVGNATPLTSVGSNGGTYDLQGTLGVGTHEVFVRSTDAAGNTIDSAHRTVIISTALPTALSSGPDLDTASDSGASNTDNITKLSTIRLYGDTANGRNVPVGSSVGIYNGSELLYKVDADGLGAWEKTLTLAASETPYQLSVTVIDAFGNESAKSPVTSVTIDQTAPATIANAATMASADDNGEKEGHYTNLNGATLSGTGAPANTLIHLYDVNSIKITSVTSDGSGNWTTSGPLSLSPGTHTIKLKAEDAAGNLSASFSPTFEITIDQQAPTLTMEFDAEASDHGFSDSDEETNDNTPTFFGNVEPGSIVTLLANNQVYGTATSDSTLDGTWSITANAWPVTGDFQNVEYRVQATDRAGNTNTIASGSGITLKLDTTAPSGTGNVTLVSGDLHATIGGVQVSMHDHLDFSGTGAPAGAKVYVYHDGLSDPIAVVTADESGNWYTEVNAYFEEEDHTIKIAYEDKAGNMSAQSAGITIRVDQTVNAGIPDMDAAYDTGTLTDDDYTSVIRPRFTGTADNGATVVLMVDGIASGTATATGGVWAITMNRDIATGDEDGNAHTVYISVTDDVGNTEDSDVLTVSYDSYVDQPSGNIYPDNGANDQFSLNDIHTSDTTPVFTGTHQEDGAIVEIYNGATLLGSGTVSGGSWSTTAPATALADGNYTLTAKVRDLAGNVNASKTFTTKIDSVAPSTTATTPQLHPDSQTGSSTTVTSDQTPKIKGSGTDGDTYVIYQGGTTLADIVGKATVVSGYWTYEASVTANTSTTFYAAAVDDAGNVGPISAAFTLTHDNIAPTLVIDLVNDSNISGDLYTNSAMSNLVVTGTAGMAVSYQGESDASPTNTTIPGDGTLELGYEEGGSDEHTVQVWSTDEAGNSTTESLTWTVDRDAPSVDSYQYTNDQDLIKVTFDENVYWNGTGTFEIYDGATNVATVSSTNVSISGDTVTLTLGSGLAEGNYTIHIPTNLYDLAGNIISGSTTTNLKVDITAPTITSTTVSYSDDTVRVSVSEALIPGPSGAFEIWTTGASPVKVIEIEEFGNDGYLYLHDLDGLAGVDRGVAYELRLVGVTDLAGNALANTNFSFTLPLIA